MGLAHAYRFPMRHTSAKASCLQTRKRACLVGCLFVLEKSSHTVAQADLKLTILPAHHRYEEYRRVPQHPTKLDFLMNMFNNALPLDVSEGVFLLRLIFSGERGLNSGPSLFVERNQLT